MELCFCRISHRFALSAGSYAYTMPLRQAMAGYLDIISGLQTQLSSMNSNVQGLIVSTSRLIPIARSASRRVKRQSPALASAIENLRNQLVSVTNQLRSIVSQNRDGAGSAGVMRQAGTSAKPTRRSTTSADFEVLIDLTLHPLLCESNYLRAGL